MDFLVITAFALIFLFLSWLYGCMVSAGRPLNTFKRRVLTYGFAFVLGMGYLMALVANLQWPKDLLLPMISVWGALVGLLAWWGYRRAKRNGPPEHP